MTDTSDLLSFHRSFFMSSITTEAALRPGAPITPPPGCVPLPHRSVTVNFDHRHPLNGGISLAAAREKEEEGEEKGEHGDSTPLSLNDPDPSSASLARRADEEKTLPQTRRRPCSSPWLR
ncbi:hypothetical protein GW17_00029964 [Ensete ventricosum]|nr:hypothetical protein GW17_00029964 [Ensete ventricosum]